MSTYVLLGRYTIEAIKGISKERTAKADELAQKFNGSIKSVYAMTGRNDLLMITEFPSTEEVMQFSVALTHLTDIAFTTAEAVTADKFDQLMSSV